jgi:hypothetical protein
MSRLFRISALRAGAALALAGAAAHAQRPTFAARDSVLERIWSLGTDSSTTYALAQTLSDSIGPRLTGSPGQRAGVNWLLSRYRGWGIPARAERYGTWRGWRRGVSHIDLVAPRVRSLEGTLLAWSPGTNGRPVEAGVVVLPDLADSAAYARWMGAAARGKLVLVSSPQPTCRPDSNWVQWATPESFERMRADRAAADSAWAGRVAKAGLTSRTLPVQLEAAGAAGVVTSLWSRGWGVTKVFDARTSRVPTVELSCEDYGLVFRLSERNQGPRLRIQADAAFEGDVPVANVIAEIRGRERPNEYVMLSAHFDSWDGASGSTDNGTGTVTMLEAMRILRRVYPNPRRTILVGHWSGEEQGLNGSRAFAADHPEVPRGLQALFNQDNGTGRVANISMQGLSRAGDVFRGWLSRVPTEITRHITVVDPGAPSGGGSDNASFICSGAPAFSLGSLSWDYGTYTWHTNRDTFDKIVLDDLRNNAVLTAMLVYLAAEAPERLARDRAATLPPSAVTGEPQSWPECQPAARSLRESRR